MVRRFEEDETSSRLLILSVGEILLLSMLLYLIMTDSHSTACVRESGFMCNTPHRRTLFLLKLGSYQFALLKTIFSIFSIVLWTNKIFNPEDASVTGLALWIGLFLGVLTIIALWPVSILSKFLKPKLKHQKLMPKCAMFQMVLIFSQLQTAIIYSLALSGTIACSPPFSSRTRGFIISQQLLILEMFIITLVNRFLYRHGHESALHAHERTGEQAEDLVKSTKIVLQTECKDDTA